MTTIYDYKATIMSPEKYNLELLEQNFYCDEYFITFEYDSGSMTCFGYNNYIYNIHVHYLDVPFNQSVDSSLYKLISLKLGIDVR